MQGLIPKHVTINRLVVHKGERLTLHLASGGGVRDPVHPLRMGIDVLVK